ncbi:MAG TPA: hypothetical protein VH499_06985 [Reyranella sp.]|jgi:hypothetical protein
MADTMRSPVRQWVHKYLRLSCEIGAIAAIFVGINYAFLSSERRPDLFFIWSGAAACVFLIGWGVTKLLDWQDYRERLRAGLE